jgi:hypothetical protein
MSELGSSTDAPPPPPPPPPPDTGSREATPDASPDLERALRDGGQSGADGGSQDGGSLAKAQEQAADARTPLEPYQQRPTDVPDGTSVTPNDTPGAGRPVGSDTGTSDGPPDMDQALGQADAVRGDLADYRQKPADVPDGTLVTPDLTPSGPPDVSPELAAALPQESEPLKGPAALDETPAAGPDEAPSAAPEQAVEPDAAQYEGQGSPQPVADSEPPLTSDPVGTEELAGLQAGPGELDSGQAAEPLQADSSDPVWHRQTWEGGTEGADLPPSMKEDLQGLGNDLREVVDPAAWEKADLDGREDMLNAANDRIREEYGLPQQDVSYRSVADDPHLAGVAGSFDPDTGEIVINRSQLADSDPGEALKTLAHENFHDYQERAQVGDSSDPFGQSRAQEWRKADANYPDPKDYGSRREYLIDYLNNPLERDARAVENEVYSGYKEDKR